MTKFILTGNPRTGTTVLSGSLITHPDVLFFGEIFNNTLQVRDYEAQRRTLGAGWMLDKPLDWGIAPCEATASTHNYLDNLFSRNTPFKVTGFKIMQDQVTEGPNSDVWTYIAEHPEIKIIRTKRDNLIDVMCSYVRASITRRWHSTGEDLPNPRFVVPPDECLALFKKFEQMPEPMRNIEETHQVLELNYNRISADFSGCMSDIYSFLKVDARENTTPKLKKIARFKPNEELANYDKLKQHFRNTEYYKYFIY